MTDRLKDPTTGAEFVNADVAGAVSRALEYFNAAAAADAARRRQRPPARTCEPAPIAPPDDAGNMLDRPALDPRAEARADAVADRMLVNREHLAGAKPFRPLEIRRLRGQEKRNRYFAVVDTSRKGEPIRGTYKSIVYAARAWPNAIVTAEAKAYALELELSPNGEI